MVRRVRLASGLILFAYLVVHFSNHALGIVSLAAMDAMLTAIYPVLASPLVTVLLLGALVVHFLLALWALWERRTLKLPPPLAVQYLLGFLVPLLLAPHVVMTRVADTGYGADYGHYRHVLLALWQLDPAAGVAQAALLLAAWVHACVGLRFWLRLKPWYEAAQPLLFAAALLLPALALAGYVAGGREVTIRMAQDAAFAERALAAIPSPEALARNEAIAWSLRGGFAAALAGVLLARALRRLVQHRRGLVRITYPDGRSIAVAPGVSVLEASRLAGVPHAAVCGGRGRCSTCRVRVRSADTLDPPGAEEARVLQRVGAAPDTRLACQFRPRSAVEVTPLLAAALPARELLRRRPGYRQGAEREIAILFADLRDFTRLAETRLPYDVVHLLNRYFQAMGEAVEAAGGRVDKFIGDGVMALFGVGAEGAGAAAEGCRAGLAAARLMSLRLDELNRALEPELAAPLRIGIGLHAGPVIVGEMGHGRAMSLTAIGDAVNTASRLEAACKTLGGELVVSEAVLACAGVELAGAARHEIEIRGRQEPLAVRVLARARELPEAGGGKR